MRAIWAACLLAAAAAAQVLGGVPLHPQFLQRRAGFAVLEVHDARGNTLRKYVGPSGLIFGVAWQGPSVPDLQALLGTRFADFQRTLREQQSQRPRRRGPLYVHVGDLVVQNGGHMRAFAGRAWLTDAVPRGLSPEVIR